MFRLFRAGRWNRGGALRPGRGMTTEAEAVAEPEVEALRRALRDDLGPFKIRRTTYRTRILMPTPVRLEPLDAHPSREALEAEIAMASEEPNNLEQVRWDEGVEEAPKVESREAEQWADAMSEELVTQVRNDLTPQTPEEVQAEHQDRLVRFRRAIIDTFREQGHELEELEDDEFPPAPNGIHAAFGTPEHPVLIPSNENERYVACQGGAGPLHHEALWHLVKKTKPLCCLDCGQVFRLVSYDEWLLWAAHEWDVNHQDTIQFFLPPRAG